MSGAWYLIQGPVSIVCTHYTRSDVEFTYLAGYRTFKSPINSLNHPPQQSVCKAHCLFFRLIISSLRWQVSRAIHQIKNGDLALKNNSPRVYPSPAQQNRLANIKKEPRGKSNRMSRWVQKHRYIYLLPCVRDSYKRQNTWSPITFREGCTQSACRSRLFFVSDSLVV